MVTEKFNVEDAAELRTENILRIGPEDRQRVVEWCRENLKGPWQLVRRHFTGEDEEAVKGAAQRERIREIRYMRGDTPAIYRFEVWELRIDDTEEAASAKLALT
jgi:hypothetical protein